MRADVEHLAAMVRDSAGEGERASAAWLADRLRAAGLVDVAIEPYRSQRTYVGGHALHALAAMVAPLPALVSLELEVSGRLQWIRRLLPSSEGANVVARTGGGERTVIVVAHHDAAHTGLVFHPRLAAHSRSRRSMAPTHAGAVPSALLVAIPRTRWLGRALLAAQLALLLDVWRSPTVPGASDNATGVAAALALAEDPPPGVELVIAIVGSEESGMGGMRAFLDQHAFDPQRTLVLCLDTLGGTIPVVARAEGSLLPHRYAEADLALAERGAARAGERVERWRIGGWTDAILARFRGLRAISLLSVGEDGGYTNYHLPSDTAANVDFDCVERCLRIARGICAEFSGR